ncbi:MAG: hypothetical protein V4711_10945, partial [Pseudomonadota bacterium]
MNMSAKCSKEPGGLSAGRLHRGATKWHMLENPLAAVLPKLDNGTQTNDRSFLEIFMTLMKQCIAGMAGLMLA